MISDKKNNLKMIILISILVLAGIAVLSSVYMYASKRISRGQNYSQIFYESIEKLKADCAENSNENYYVFYSCADGEYYYRRHNGQEATDALTYGSSQFEAENHISQHDILQEILAFINVEYSRISLQPILAEKAKFPVTLPTNSTIFEIGYWNEELSTKITYAVTSAGSMLILDQRDNTGKYYILANGMFSELGLLHLQ